MKVSYREQHIELEKNKGIYTTNQTSGIEIIQRDEETLFIVTKDKVHTVRCLDINKDEKEITLLHQGQKTHLYLAEPMNELLKSMGLEGALTPKINDLKAPMPGLVLDIVITAGDVVSKGDKLLILEAMKMENAIKAPADLKIKEIHTATGSAVDKNQVLITFDS
ncbi:MAG: acetyl-CoA carboxylase biotin carboxyl carrier protein subunit [Bacteroidota bacterium]|nr:acetyl-CoA carboxylase biotin carboxyl carrier protein subunit [Bacteroidota bacterium]